MKAKAKIGSFLSPGSVVLIRTVTHYHVGRVKGVVMIGGAGFVELSDAAWVSDTGRFTDALKSGNLNEVEPFVDNVLIGVGAIIDVTRFIGTIPLVQK